MRNITIPVTEISVTPGEIPVSNPNGFFFILAYRCGMSAVAEVAFISKEFRKCSIVVVICFAYAKSKLESIKL